MPIFEYQCKQCGHEFEKLVFDSKAVECPKCKSSQTEKKISVFASTKTAGNNAGGPSRASSCNNFT